MAQLPKDDRAGRLAAALDAPAPPAAMALADQIERLYPGSAVILYGSGISVLSGADPKDVLFDFYVIAPSYGQALGSPLMRFFAWLIPPNVYYVEWHSAEHGTLRAKYALLSSSQFERLTGPRCFHSYFWARFAQPCRLLRAPDNMRARIETAILNAIDTFVARAAALVDDKADAKSIWRAGLSKSYKAELRAEAPNRVDRLIETYGDWPETMTITPSRPGSKRAAEFVWRMRALQGGVLSVLRLLKGTLTFDGGIDYIAWKIKRHSGVDVPVREWERRVPLFGAPIVALRYYALRAKAKK